MHLLAMPGDRAPVRALANQIEVEMLRNNASLDLCRYSDEPFDTADIVGPHWSESVPSEKRLVAGGRAGAGLTWLWLAVRPKQAARRTGGWRKGTLQPPGFQPQLI